MPPAPVREREWDKHSRLLIMRLPIACILTMFLLGCEITQVNPGLGWPVHWEAPIGVGTKDGQRHIGIDADTDIVTSESLAIASRIIRSEFGGDRGSNLTLAASRDGQSIALTHSNEMQLSPVMSAVTLWWADWRGSPHDYIRWNGYVIPLACRAAMFVDSREVVIRHASGRSPLSLRRQFHPDVLSGASSIPITCVGDVLISLGPDGSVLRHQLSACDPIAVDAPADVTSVDSNVDGSVISVVRLNGDVYSSAIHSPLGVSQVNGEFRLSPYDYTGMWIETFPDSTRMHRVQFAADGTYRVTDSRSMRQASVFATPSRCAVQYSYSSTWSKHANVGMVEFASTWRRVKSRYGSFAWVTWTTVSDN